jgi:hypothetical protein
MTVPAKPLTQERLKELLDYDPETGIFTWRVDRGYKAKAGTIAGYESKGYWMIGVDRIDKSKDSPYQAGRLAFLWMTGTFPNADCDHADGNPLNNKWTNLREASRSQNQRNKRVQSNNVTGLKGVSLHRGTKWVARIKVDGEKKPYLGIFDCPAAAHFAYIVAADEHFGEFARA